MSREQTGLFKHWCSASILQSLIRTSATRLIVDRRDGVIGVCDLWGNIGSKHKGLEKIGRWCSSEPDSPPPSASSRQLFSVFLSTSCLPPLCSFRSLCCISVNGGVAFVLLDDAGVTLVPPSNQRVFVYTRSPPSSPSGQISYIRSLEAFIAVLLELRTPTVAKYSKLCVDE